jgi:putative membrane-bound dehydrogenase-like protein
VFEKRMMKSLSVLLIVCFALQLSAVADDDYPIVPIGFTVDLIASEPLVSNPCVMAFDRLGRICVAQGPQWRGPTPETPGDRVDILIDADGDGTADGVKTFASGFNSIQGIAWHGNDLWIANSPDLTVVRDIDGDDEADLYIRVYTGLGNLEHALHGLNFGPDGKLYMSKGNSKGYNTTDQLAPKVFRELWGLPSPEGAPDYTDIEVFTRDDYRRSYHSPQDDWGQQGGILRCDPYHMGSQREVRQPASRKSAPAGAAAFAAKSVSGRNLEIVSRGFRNPWDIAFDDAFDWIGTDNDQSSGDRIFMPFYGAHFGWGHPWSFSWTGAAHLPTVPVSAATFEGSGTGVTYYHASQFPEQFRDVFFIGDWLRREVFTFRPRWDGALMVADAGSPTVFAHAGGGRTMPRSDGRVFDPTDLVVGPDGCLYVLSWGHEYGGELQDGQQTNAGRVYRIRYTGNGLQTWEHEYRSTAMSDWTLSQLFADLGSHVEAWRVNAQEELLRRSDAAAFLRDKLSDADLLSKAQQTWSIWTLARMGELSPHELASRLQTDNRPATEQTQARNDGALARNARIQMIRALAYQQRERDRAVAAQVALQGSDSTDKSSAKIRSQLRPHVADLLAANEPRLRFAAVQAVGQARIASLTDELINRMATEFDRITFYAMWNVTRDLVSTTERREMLHTASGGARLGLLLGLLADDALTAEEVEPLRNDSDQRVAAIAEQWLIRTGAAEPLITINPPPGSYREQVRVEIATSLPGHRVTYTLDGSVPAATSPSWSGPLLIDRTTTLKVAVLRENALAGRVVSAEYRILPTPEYQGQRFVSNATTPSGRQYVMDYHGLQAGKRVYTDRDYEFTNVPDELVQAPFLRVANNDDRSQGARWLTFTLDAVADVLVGVDTRSNAPLEWMKLGKPGGFSETQLLVETNDADFRMFRRRFSPGQVVLGGNTNAASDSGRGNYIVVFDREILAPTDSAATQSEVLAAMQNADPRRGRELFMHPRGAGCVKCHAMHGPGPKLAPDLSDLGNRAKSADTIVTAILAPSATITEGFAQQQFVMASGQVIAGAVIEETQRSLKVVGTDGVLQTVPVAEIEERVSTTLSPMPAGFDKMMSAQQIADVVAWLMTQKASGTRNGFSFQESNDSFDIYFGEQRIATYLKRHPRLTRRALVNVMTPGGIQVTRNFPPRIPEDIDPGYSGENGIIHPHMHPGIWLGYGYVDGNDYWRLQAKVVFEGFVEQPKGNANTATFAVRNRFMSEDGERTVCMEITRYRFERVSAGLLLRLDAEYKSDDHDFSFGDQEESGLAVRVASPIRVQGGNGTILNDRGERNGSEVWGKEALWFDYFGTINDRQVGIMVAASPHNPRASWLHARDYGVIATNPFPKQPTERREPFVRTRVRRGETFRLSYAILIHDLPADEPLDRHAAYNEMLESFNSDKTAAK